MNPNNYQISKLEMTITLISMIIGVGILTLPRTLASATGTPDGWISLIIGTVINMMIVYLIVKLHRNFPNLTILQFMCSSQVGKWLGKPLAVFFAIYFIMLLGYEARVLSVVIQMYLLDRTPSEISIVLMLLATTYAATKGVQGIIHLNLMFIPFVFTVLFLLIIFNVPNANFDVLLPVAAEGLSPILLGLNETVLSFLGVEILFFFLAFMKMNDMKATSLNIGIALIGFIYIVVSVLSYAVLSFVATDVLVFPLVTLAKEVEIVEGVVERYDPLMMAIWIMTIFNTMSIVHFLATMIVKDEFLKKSRISSIAIGITFIAFIVSFIPNSIQEAFMMGDYTAYLGYGLISFSLIGGNLFVWVKKRQKRQSKSEAM